MSCTPKRSLFRDAASVLLIALLSLATRLPVIGGSFDVDEHWYLAAAAYNVAHGLSPYECPGDALSRIIGIYQLCAVWFGTYNLAPLHWLVFVCCAATASLLYFWLSRSTSWVLGLAAALLFVIVNPRWQGWSANREWLALPFLFGGVILARWALTRTGCGNNRAQAVRLALAGCAFALAIVGKEQALPFLLVVPLVLFLRSLTLGSWPAAGHDFLWYALGAAFGLSVFLVLPYALHHTLDVYAASFKTNLTKYVIDNQWAASAATSGRAGILEGLYLKHTALPGSGVLLLGYLAGSLQLLRAALAVQRRAKAAEPRTAARDEHLALAYVLAAIVAVQAGGRFYLHYFLFLLPGCLALVAVTLRGLAAGEGKRYAVFGSAVLLLGAVVQIALEAYVASTKSAFVSCLFLLAFGLAAGLSLLTCVRGGLGLVFRERILDGLASERPANEDRAHPAGSLLVANAAIWICACFGATTVVLGMLPVITQPMKVEAKMVALAEFFTAVRHDGDRLFVWGWAPTVYAAARMEPASRFVSCQTVVGDWAVGAERRGSWDERNGEILMADLTASPPEFFVDARLQSNTLSRQSIYTLGRYPELAEFVRSNYRLRHEVDGCRVYVRKDIPR